MSNLYHTAAVQNFIKVSKHNKVVAHYNTWDGSHDFLGGTVSGDKLPGVFMTNFALAHSLNIDLVGRDDYFRSQSRTVRMWRSIVMKDVVDGKYINKAVSFYVCLNEWMNGYNLWTNFVDHTYRNDCN